MPGNLPFPFPPFSFSFLFSLRTVFLFVPFFLSFLSFLLFYSFSIFSSHFYFIFSSHLPISVPFWSIPLIRSKEEISSPFPQVKCVALNFPSLFLISLFLFMTSSPTWLNMSHRIHFPHMANCEPFLQCQVSLSWGAMWHPLTLPCVI